MESTVIKRRNKNEKSMQPGIIDCEKLLKENIIKQKHGIRYPCKHNNIWTTLTNNSNNNNQERKMPGTRSGSNGSGLTPDQRAAVLAAFGGDQAVAARMIGIMEGKVLKLEQNIVGIKATNLASSQRHSKMNCAHGDQVLKAKLIFRKLKKNIRARKEKQVVIAMSNRDDGIGRKPSTKQRR